MSPKVSIIIYYKPQGEMWHLCYAKTKKKKNAIKNYLTHLCIKKKKKDTYLYNYKSLWNFIMP